MQSTCNHFFYDFELERVRKTSKRQLAREKRKNAYVNPVTLAREYQRIMQEEGISQSQLAAKLDVLRVRMNQYLALLKLPEERQAEILKFGKERMITERALRHDGFQIGIKNHSF